MNQDYVHPDTELHMLYMHLSKIAVSSAVLKEHQLFLTLQEKIGKKLSEKCKISINLRNSVQHALGSYMAYEKALQPMS